MCDTRVRIQLRFLSFVSWCLNFIFIALLLAELYDIHLETDTLCAGETDLYVYDRGMVSGSIPFTRFVLNHEEVCSGNLLC
jgi:hypothetical protein